MDPLFTAVTPILYSSSTSNKGEPDRAFTVSFGDGHVVSRGAKNDLYFVRAVRHQLDTSVFDGRSDNAPRRPWGNGDVNGDGKIDVSDAIFLLGWLFLGGESPVSIVCPPRGGGPLPATGQTVCYDDTGNEIACDSEEFPGQDGLYRAGCSPSGRFADNGDGTVTDLCTDLVWQKSTADTNGDGAIGADDRLLWGAALRYCDELVFAGHSDWRLPNVRELYTIVDHGLFDPTLPPPFEGESVAYWQSTTHLRTPDDAWVVHFVMGHITDCQKDFIPPPGDSVVDCRCYVRAVRSRR